MIDKINEFKLQQPVSYPDRFVLNKIKDLVNNEAGYPAMKIEYKDSVVISLQLGSELVISKFDNARQAIIKIEEIFRA